MLTMYVCFLAGGAILPIVSVIFGFLNDGADADVSSDAGIDADAGIGLGSGIDVDTGVGLGSGIDVDTGIGLGSGIDIDTGIGFGSGIDIDSGVGLGSGLGSGIDVDTGIGLGSGVDLDTGIGLGAGTDIDTGIDYDTGGLARGEAVGVNTGVAPGAVTELETVFSIGLFPTSLMALSALAVTFGAVGGIMTYGGINKLFTFIIAAVTGYTISVIMQTIIKTLGRIQTRNYGINEMELLLYDGKVVDTILPGQLGSVSFTTLKNVRVSYPARCVDENLKLVSGKVVKVKEFKDGIFIVEPKNKYE